MSGYKGHSVGAVVLLLVAMHYFGNYFHNPDLVDIILYVAIAVVGGRQPSGERIGSSWICLGI